MQIDLSKKEFRRLLDMVYIGNWILNSTRGDDRFADYDDLESKLFALCREQGMDTLVERYVSIFFNSNHYRITKTCKLFLNIHWRNDDRYLY